MSYHGTVMPNSVISLSGVLVQVDLEGGYLALETKDGKRYRLVGESPLLTKPGVALTVQGTLQKETWGIGFGTPTLQVITVKPS